MTYTITENKEFNSIEISFTEKPDEKTRETLKANKFRWHSVKKVWYGYKDKETVRELLEGNKKTTENKSTTKANKYGVKVGDIFSASWGYEQTNVDFFQVVALVGESSVRVREVCPEILESSPVSSMSEDRIYKITNKLLPPVSRSVFITDQENGDIKRLTLGYKDEPKFKLTSYADAYLCKGETVKEYVSWYA